MNRRSFFSTLAKATAGFAILPAATTYDRVWKAAAVIKPVRIVPNPEWFTAPYEMSFIMSPEPFLVVQDGIGEPIVFKRGDPRFDAKPLRSVQYPIRFDAQGMRVDAFKFA